MYKKKKTARAELLFLQIKPIVLCCSRCRRRRRCLKCPYDQIFDFHFFTFSCTIRPSYSSCQISNPLRTSEVILF